MKFINWLIAFITAPFVPTKPIVNGIWHQKHEFYRQITGGKKNA